MTIPLHLNVPAFLAKWEAWVAFRRKMQRVGDWDAMFNEQLSFLDRHTVEEAVEILSQSIRNGWRGLFAVKTGGVEFKKAGSVWEWNERIAAITARVRAIKAEEKSYAYTLHKDTASFIQWMEEHKPDNWEARAKAARESRLNYVKTMKPAEQELINQLLMEKSGLEQLKARGTNNES